jgi:hypothetical protein
MGDMAIHSYQNTLTKIMTNRISMENVDNFTRNTARENAGKPPYNLLEKSVPWPDLNTPDAQKMYAKLSSHALAIACDTYLQAFNKLKMSPPSVGISSMNA